MLALLVTIITTDKFISEPYELNKLNNVSTREAAYESIQDYNPDYKLAYKNIEKYNHSITKI